MCRSPRTRTASDPPALADHFVTTSKSRVAQRQLPSLDSFQPSEATCPASSLGPTPIPFCQAPLRAQLAGVRGMSRAAPSWKWGWRQEGTLGTALVCIAPGKNHSTAFTSLIGGASFLEQDCFLAQGREKKKKKEKHTQTDTKSLTTICSCNSTCSTCRHQACVLPDSVLVPLPSQCAHTQPGLALKSPRCLSSSLSSLHSPWAGLSNRDSNMSSRHCHQKQHISGLQTPSRPFRARPAGCCTPMGRGVMGML